MYSLTCFGRPHVHHQERTAAQWASGLPLERGGWSVFGRGLAGYAGTPTVKPEAPSAVVLPDDGRRGARNMLSHT